MKNLIKNPLTIWCAKLAYSKMLEYKFRDKKLKIDCLSNTKNSVFGLYNKINANVSLNECTLGDFTIIGGGTKISKTIIGKFCSIGPDCKIGLSKHPVKDFVSSHPIFYSTLKQAQITFADQNYFEEFEEISIGNDVWIGANVIVMDGVKIADGAIVAAGAVVVKDIPPYAIVGGVPAKIIRYRFEQDQIEKLLEIKWWGMELDYLKNNFKKFHKIDDFLEFMSGEVIEMV